MTPEQRIKELRVRQVYYGSSLVCKLNAINGKFHYKVYGWFDQANQESKFVLKHGKYNGEDPDELFQLALLEAGIKKIKLGKVIGNGGSLIT